ncbi:hypothetical protein AJ11_01000 [Mycobacterium tuberculosis MD17656]|nr:hypothetical protein AJ11_01000 [Mycobacterium tuberculosis MD17656]
MRLLARGRQRSPSRLTIPAASGMTCTTSAGVKVGKTPSATAALAREILLSL